jgi:hypothetical protein
MKKKSKKSRKKHNAAEEYDKSEQQDELLALSAIFADELAVNDDEQGFALRVQPHQGEADVNYVAVTIQVM